MKSSVWGVTTRISTRALRMIDRLWRDGPDATGTTLPERRSHRNRACRRLQPVGVVGLQEAQAGAVVVVGEPAVGREQTQREFGQHPQLDQHLVVGAIHMRA